MVKLVVAVTDNGWFEALRQKQNLSEVNFWAPSGQNFKALQPGEFFLFKLHAPYNAIVGGGVFAYATQLPCSLAWEAFGEANGADSFENMRNRIWSKISRNRRGTAPDRTDFPIGCRILTQPFFFDESDWIPVPASFKKNIVKFKTYDTGDHEGQKLWDAVRDALYQQQFPPLHNPVEQPRPPGGVGTDSENIGATADTPLERYGAPTLIRPRLGQGAFRVLVTDIYQRRCAVTKERVLPVLDAAHILPYKNGGKHEASNGLLLRRDIHSLFDAGYVTVTPDFHFEVSRKLMDEYKNGKVYYALQGKEILTPQDAKQRPDAEALAWHNEHCFRA